MRTFAALFVASTLISAPAFAQVASTDGASRAAASTADRPSKDLSLGYIDQFTIKNGTERPVMTIAPIEKNQLDLAWRPGGKWGLTLDLTTRAPNDLLPREELQAGAYYQVTPRFRFGGGLTLKGESLSSPETWKQEQADTGVHIESAFSF
ncbi:MAG: hypothetical protein GC155_08100 [Alphaproteobacteria bacterium]|nr:hypothetical protein [Alphaproteobacteria bacterium]